MASSTVHKLNLPKPYRGPERRQRGRRVNGDRRADVRWEPGKEHRRLSRGRRASDVTWL